MGSCFLYVYNSQIVGFHVFEVVGKGVPENTEAPSNELLELLNMGSISSLKHAMFFLLFFLFFNAHNI